MLEALAYQRGNVIGIGWGPTGANETRVVKRFAFFSAKRRKQPSEYPERRQWRAHEDRPLSLTAPRFGDTATSQRALVIAFAALAVAGGAYFATVMLTHEGGDTRSLLAKADEALKASVAASGPSSAVAAPASGVRPVAQAAKKDAPSVAPVAPHPLTPTPVKVTTITIPAKPTAAPAKPAAAPVDASQSAEQRWASLSGDAQPAQPAQNPTEAAAYSDQDKQLVSEGVESVLRAATGKPPAKKPLVVAAATKPDNPAGASDEEDVDMAGKAPAGSRQARIRSSVNMRTRPVSGSKVILVIPSNSVVGLAPGCEHWCRVSYKGQTGYIYKSYLRR